MLSYFLAVLAACANATSSVPQRKANREIPQQENLSWKLIQSLLHKPAGRSGGKGSSSLQAAVFGVAGGSAFGLTAALMKGMTTRFSNGFGALFTSWQIYAMAATGLLGMFLVQSALNAGRLIAAQPGLTLSDPIVSILWGVLAFHERVSGGTPSLLCAALSTVLMTAAVVVLARSPVLSDDHQKAAGDHQDRHRRGGQPQSESPHAARG